LSHFIKMLINDCPIIVAEAGGSRKGKVAAGRRVGALKRRSVKALSGPGPEWKLDPSTPSGFLSAFFAFFRFFGRKSVVRRS
jgi:hypothetical protein